MTNKDIKENILTIGITTICIVVCLILLPKLIMGDSLILSNQSEETPKGAVEKKEDSYIKVSGKKEVEVYREKTGKVEKVKLEDYIFGVVSGEMPVDFNMEALKAQAVAARTYYFSKQEEKCNVAMKGDICDTIHCQVYMNEKERKDQWSKKSAEKNYQKIKQAVKETEGMVLTYDNEIIKYPQFFSTSSGKTENSEDVFVSAVPYLKSIESPGEQVAPRYSESKEFTNAEFARKVNSKGANISVNNINKNIKIINRTDGGSVEKIRIGNITLKGTEFRKLFDLNSANFDLEFFKDKVKISCIGNGHGVGMSQWGANIMAEKGKKYDEILKHYYSGVKIKKIKFK